MAVNGSYCPKTMVEYLHTSIDSVDGCAPHWSQVSYVQPSRLTVKQCAPKVIRSISYGAHRRNKVSRQRYMTHVELRHGSFDSDIVDTLIA